MGKYGVTLYHAIAMLLDWILNPPNKKISWKQASSWLLFPFFYVV